MTTEAFLLRSVLAVFGIYVLALLLASTLPVAGGDAVHGGALVHAAIPHVHYGTSSRAARHPAKVGLAAAFDASPGDTSDLPSAGLTPPLPRFGLGARPGDAGRRLIPIDSPRPPQRLEPPPEPPPTLSLPA